MISLNTIINKNIRVGIVRNIFQASIEHFRELKHYENKIEIYKNRTDTLCMYVWYMYVVNNLYPLERNQPIGLPFVACEWHILYKTHIHRTIFGKFDKIANFVFVKIAH